jgi:enoyl-[acyl-carrier protein] reductase I
MGLFSGKKGIIMGVANNRSIATGIAEFLHKEGATLGYSFLPDDKGKMEQRVRKATEALNPQWLHPCNVDSDSDVETFFKAVEQQFSNIDFLVHSIAYAPLEDIRCPTIEVSRPGFLRAMETSVYSLISVTKHASRLMNAGASIVTLSYYGGEKVIAGYNLMGLAKSALESTVRYLAYDLGEKNIRVNALSAGPIKTLASSAIGDFNQMLEHAALSSPLKRVVTLEELGKASGFLLSDLSSGMTGETMHVDCGYNIMGIAAK